ncbi:hypothetical protein H6F98_14310 [Microcoleus sp. FACHB-SPT15]|uniref:hypothetical protein n=1 Tax=Microcoleus sp. FACHB-SPT15 TaxID=2692830 RepID=UPI00177AD779|nr:hypothetical protein [Microcoleus sp. FACHB-SPT15]MBD1806620.1 hypothetical protein [Microcoleus sp. FACHB-SPT15]
MTTIQINPNELSDKRVLATGETKGMGEAIVNRLRQVGATVITTTHSKPDELRSPDFFIQSDISTFDGVEKVVKEVLARPVNLTLWRSSHVESKTVSKDANETYSLRSKLFQK